MDEMMTRYIFKHMRITESRLDMMGKDLVRQVKLNKRTTRFAVAVTASIFVLGYIQSKITNEIAELREEVDELKIVKGE